MLEASYLVRLLQPYHRNYNKRLIKAPKLYFLDTGLATRLLGIREPSQLETHPARGALFESFVFAELLKTRVTRHLPWDIWFWSDQGGHWASMRFRGYRPIVGDRAAGEASLLQPGSSDSCL